MTRKYFGTDGIRGRANGVITPDLALRVGQATGLAFRRGEHTASVTNFGPVPISLPAHRGVVLSSAPLEDGALPPDTTVWLDL